MSEMTARRGGDGIVIGLVSGAHLFSHFYMLVLPPLFPLLKQEFGVSYAQLGGIFTAFSIASGGTQYLMGVLVDRFGARYLLVAGLTVVAVSFGLMSLTHSYLALLALALCAGFGNAVFHPADYTILAATVRPERLGRAFGVHTFSGQIGWAIAPSLVLALTALWNWRWAVAAVSLLGIGMALLLLVNRGRLRDRPAEAPAARPAGGVPALGIGLLLSAPVLLMFVFYTATASIQIGLQSFTPTALIALFGVPLITATAALTGFLVGSASGVLAGGFVADRLHRLDLVAAIGFTAAAASVCVAALVPLPPVLQVAIFAFTGFMLGMIAPSRDLLVRNIAPPGASGKVFGFVSTGLDVGGASAPLAFGWILDQGRPTLMFFAAAAIMMVTMITGLAASRVGRPAASPVAAE